MIIENYLRSAGPSSTTSSTSSASSTTTAASGSSTITVSSDSSSTSGTLRPPQASATPGGPSVRPNAPGAPGGPRPHGPYGYGYGQPGPYAGATRPFVSVRQCCVQIMRLLSLASLSLCIYISFFNIRIHGLLGFLLAGHPLIMGKRGIQTSADLMDMVSCFLFLFNMWYVVSVNESKISRPFACNAVMSSMLPAVFRFPSFPADLLDVRCFDSSFFRALTKFFSVFLD